MDMGRMRRADPFYWPPRRGKPVRVKDGRVGWVVYHGLDGYGVSWDGPDGSLDAMLRDPWRGAQVECVGAEFEEVTCTEI